LYDSKSNEAQVFFKTVQNKMLWTVTSKAVAELIIKRANADIPNMGLTKWQSHRVKAEAALMDGFVTLSTHGR